MTIIEFLNRRLQEDLDALEELARQLREEHTPELDVTREGIHRYLANDESLERRRWFQLLTDFKAKQKIVALHTPTVTKVDRPPFDATTGERLPQAWNVECPVCGWVADDPTCACETIRLLAAPYTDHPDYYSPIWRYR